MFIETLLEDPVYFIRVVAILIISISLHELGHGLAAIYQGDRTPIERGHITLNPVVHMGVHSLLFLVIVGIAWGQMPVDPRRFRAAKWGNILVSAAGPLTNIVLGLLAISVIKISLAFSLTEIISFEFFALIAYFNFALCLFNLMPIPPLDGFHVASEFFPSLKAIANSNVALAIFAILFITGASSVFFQVSGFIVRALIY